MLLKNKYYYIGELLIRKEHFGTLILMKNGKRYLVDNVFFNILKKISQHKPVDTSTDKVFNFINDLLNKKIITPDNRHKGTVKIINNKFVSNDCLSYPRTVYWECTNFCNYNCIHCYSDSGVEGKDSHLSFHVVKKMLQEFAKNGVEFISIGGGEPLLYPDIYKVIKLCSKLKLAVEITTNGYLLGRAAVIKLKKAGLKFIQISFDGATKTTYEKIRRNGKFDRVVAAMRLASKNFTLSVCTVANKININEIPDIIRIAKNVGAPHYRILPQMDAGRGAAISKLKLSRNELRKLNADISKYKKSEKKINIQFNENLLSPTQKNISWMPSDHFGCPAGRTTCSIDEKGNVYPCSFMADDRLICGNIVNGSLLSIWKNSDVLKHMRSLSRIYGKCSNCKHLSECRGGCRATAYLKYGDLGASDPLCTVK